MKGVFPDPPIFKLPTIIKFNGEVYRDRIYVKKYFLMRMVIKYINDNGNNGIRNIFGNLYQIKNTK